MVLTEPRGWAYLVGARIGLRAASFHRKRGTVLEAGAIGGTQSLS